MRQYRIHKIFLLVFILLLKTGYVNAQDNIESRTIKVKKDVLCQIDFTTECTADFSLPKNSTDFYDLDKTNAGKSITIVTKQENLPPTTLVVRETNGKVWNISFEYKDDLDPENEAETNNDFSDNTTDSKKAGSNIVLTPTNDKLTLSTQKKSIPYDTQTELEQFRKTYPEIEFNLIPPQQTINLADTKNDLAFNEALYEKRSELNLAFRSDLVSIKIVCQNLVFENTNGYLKLLIQNNTEEEFLTGNMILTVIRQNGSTLKLHPGYIYPKQFPVIKPGFQKAIIYSFKAYDIADEDNLKFEIHDRRQKINLEFHIAGAEYNKLVKE